MPGGTEKGSSRHGSVRSDRNENHTGIAWIRRKCECSLRNLFQSKMRERQQKYPGFVNARSTGNGEASPGVFPKGFRLGASLTYDPFAAAEPLNRDSRKARLQRVRKRFAGS